MIFDSHSHTEFSADSDMLLTEAYAKAESLGIGLLCTEHLDFDYPGERDFTFDPHEYWRRYGPLRGGRLRLGVEIGLQPHLAGRNRDFIREAPFDFVIGSIHLVAGRDIYRPESYGGREKDDFYREYFSLMAAEVRAHDYIDALGHIDYICRYAPYENPELSYGEFQPEIDEVLKAVVETGKVMELNTRRLKSRRALKELTPVYKRYHDLGGRYVTLGSDAHRAGSIGENFAAARELAAYCDLAIVTFCGRKPELCAP